MRSYLIFAITLALSSVPALGKPQKSESQNPNLPKYDLKPAKGARTIAPGNSCKGYSGGGSCLPSPPPGGPTPIPYPNRR
jgi:hypothetical protein